MNQIRFEKSIHTALRGTESWEIPAHASDPSVIDEEEWRGRRLSEVAPALAADVEAAVKSGRFEELLVRHEAKFGDVFFIPGGLVHAIGDGVKLYEVQQSSNTTFRLYDWNRVGADGKPRELHIEKGLQAIDYALPVPVPCKDLDTPFFRFSQMPVHGAEVLVTEPGEFLALYTARNDVDLDGRRTVEGTSVLIPPSSTCTLFATDSLVFLTRFRGKLA